MVDLGPEGLDLKYIPPEGFVGNSETSVMTFGDGDFIGPQSFSENGFTLQTDPPNALSIGGFSGAGDEREYLLSGVPNDVFITADNGQPFDFISFDFEPGEGPSVFIFHAFNGATEVGTFQFDGFTPIGTVFLPESFKGLTHVGIEEVNDDSGRPNIDNLTFAQPQPTTILVTADTMEMFDPVKVVGNMQTIEVDLVIKGEGEIDPEEPGLEPMGDKVFTNDTGTIEIPIKALLANDELLGGALDQPGFSFELVNGDGDYTGAGTISIDDNGTLMEGDDTVVIAGVDDDAVRQFEYRVTNNALTATAVVMVTHVSGVGVVGDPTMGSILVLDESALAQTMTGGSGDDFYIIPHDSPVSFIDDPGGTDTILPSLEVSGPLNLDLASGFDTDTAIEKIDASMFPDDVAIQPGSPGAIDWDFSQTELDEVASITGSSTFENSIVGSDGDDVIFGGAGDDEIDGGMGSDTIFGGGGDDVISGGDQADSLFGGTGEDTAFGGSGDDFFSSGFTGFAFDQSSTQDWTGGAGADTFQVLDQLFTFDGASVLIDVKGDGTVTIQDFEIGIDKLQIQLVAGSTAPSSLANLDLLVDGTNNLGKVGFADDATDTTITFNDTSGTGTDTSIVLKGITGNGTLGDNSIDNFTDLDAILGTAGTPIDFV